MKTKTNYHPAAIAFCLLLLPFVAHAQAAPAVQNSFGQLIGSLLLVAVVIGVVYNFWRTTQAYGGIIGQGIRRVGIGILLFSILALDRVVQNFADLGFIGSVFPGYETTGQDALLLLGLFSVTMGFIKLSSALKK